MPRRLSRQAELVALRKLLSDLSVAVHFDVDSSMTAQRYRQALDAISEASRSIDSLTVRLVGHADPRGSETYNQRLSEARALSVGTGASRCWCFTGDDSNGGSRRETGARGWSL